MDQSLVEPKSTLEADRRFELPIKMTSENDKVTAVLIGGTGATGKEVLKELSASDLISKIIFISRRALEFPDQPKVICIFIHCFGDLFISKFQFLVTLS